jgi:hypothetical protein
MGLKKKTSGSSSPAWEVKLRAKIDELRRLEQKAFGPRHGKTDSYNYLKAVYGFCDWSDPKVSQRVGGRVAQLYDMKVRAGALPIRIVIDATSKEEYQTKSRWVQALEYVGVNRIPAKRFKTFMTEERGIEACARKMAALRKQNRSGWARRWPSRKT